MRAVAEQGALRGFGWTVSVVHVAVSGTGLQCSGNPMAGRGASVTMELLPTRSEEHTSELQSLMRISYAVFCLKKKKKMNRLLLQPAANLVREHVCITASNDKLPRTHY